MSIENLNSFARDDRASELRTINAENVLMRHYLDQRQPQQTDADRVRQALSDGPKTISYLKSIVAGNSNSAVAALSVKGEVRQKSRGVWELVCVALLLVGCSTPAKRTIQPPPLPPIPQHTQRQTTVELFAVAPPAVLPTKSLRWNKGDTNVATHTQIWETQDLKNWRLIASVPASNEQFTITTTNTRAFYKIRNELNGNYSNWSTK